MTGFRRLPALLLTTLALVAGVTGCAQRPQPTEPPGPVQDPASSFPAKVSLPGQDSVTIAQQPKSIVSLSPTATETLFAIGAGEQVTAVDQSSTFPKEAPRTDINALNADAATVGSHDPDLVIAPESATDLVNGLKAVDVPVLVTPAAQNLEQAYRQIEVLGKATGHNTQAREVTDRMRGEINELVSKTPKPDRPLTYFHEVSPDFYTATSRSFVGSVYSKFGLVNIADQAQGDFPQLSGEEIVQANPDLVFLADTRCCGVTPESVADRPGWGSLGAVQNDRVVALNDDVAGRWGPRVVEMVRAVSNTVANSQNP